MTELGQPNIITGLFFNNNKNWEDGITYIVCKMYILNLIDQIDP